MIRLNRFRLLSFLFCLAAATPALAAPPSETQTLYLSGIGKDDPVKWNFTCDAGMNANKPSTINVPSNWELQGYGIYTYGTDKRTPWPKVQGKYSRTFTVPDDWKNLQTNIVFEGVMTDAAVTVNGQSAGPKHQGGYFRFKYDISRLLKPAGQENTVEVTVDDESGNDSVNHAERRGDYWNYAGIFRPVYLEAVPLHHIERVAIDAKADGTLNADVVLQGFPTDQTRPWWVQAQLLDSAGKPIGDPFPAPSTFDNSDTTHLSTKIANPQLWTAETPNLYQLEVRVGVGQTIVHSIRQKFGFRTITVTSGQGLLLNGQRIILKGADRHSFWPDSGRTLSPEISHDDIALMKEMNMNAVRCSHYPPDQHFLDACDAMGMYVLDELPGWHAHYDDAIGHTLVQAMVTRDVNHPSILFWDNGNEGGWNNNLNDDFAKWDPQKRNVIHPWELFRGVDTKHYPDYNTFVRLAAGNSVFFPTEFLHGLYDGGAGSGLEDYWNVVYKSKVAAGGIIWSLLDEDVKRTDKGGKLDSNGNQAPDGILGPYREKEGSFYTIKELWSPIVLTSKKLPINQPGLAPATYGPLTIENRFDFIDAQKCSFTWELRKFKSPKDNAVGSQLVLSGRGVVSSSIPPHTSGTVELQGLHDTGLLADSGLFLRANDPDGRELYTWCLPLNDETGYLSLLKDTAPTPGKVTAAETPAAIEVTAADLTLSFSKKTGYLTSAARAGKAFPLTNGPRLLAIAPTRTAARGQPAIPPAQPIPESPLSSLTQKSDGDSIIVTATYFADVGIQAGRLKTVTTTLRPNGWATVDYVYTVTGTYEYFGVGYDLPDTAIKSMRYLGNGPATVYQNRIPGGTLDVWEKQNNTTIDGDPDTLAPGAHFDYPLFKGFYASVRWLTLQTTAAPITALVNQDDLFVQVLTPNLPPANIQMNTTLPFPKAGLAFLHAIPAMGSKFAKGNTTGPHGQPTQATGQDLKGSISLYFGDLK